MSKWAIPIPTNISAQHPKVIRIVFEKSNCFRIQIVFLKIENESISNPHAGTARENCNKNYIFVILIETADRYNQAKCGLMGMMEVDEDGHDTKHTHNFRNDVEHISRHLSIGYLFLRFFFSFTF